MRRLEADVSGGRAEEQAVLTDEGALAPTGAAAVRIVDLVDRHPEDDLIHISGSERRAGDLARVLQALAPDLESVLYPAWDCLPYDRISPSREVMGRRVAVLRRLAEPNRRPHVVLTTPNALVQRVPPRELWSDLSSSLRVGEPLDLEPLRAFFHRVGYFIDVRVDEPGEVALRGSAIDVFPAAAASPCRIEHGDGLISAIRVYDAVTQRTIAELETLQLDPASEAILTDEGSERFPGIEHWIPMLYSRLESAFDYLANARIAVEPSVESRRAALGDQIAEAYQARRGPRANRHQGAAARQVLPPKRLYMDEKEWRAQLAARRTEELDVRHGLKTVPKFALDANPARALGDYVARRLEARTRVALAAASDRDAKALARVAVQRLGRSPEEAADWRSVLASKRGSLLALRLDLDSGFVDDPRNVVVIAAADLLGTRAGDGSMRVPSGREAALGEAEIAVGDAVVHLDHGLAAFRGIETISSDGSTIVEGVQLEFAGGTKLTVPTDDMDRIWRYGADAAAVSLDRLGSDAWNKRRAAVESEVNEAASRLSAFAKARRKVTVPKLVPPRRKYEQFSARFPFSETADQGTAIKDVLKDLASGRPMDCLVCGDVGFGKTEVALRAAAAAALAGKQVAVAAPTTVLARQHLRTFQRRFAGFGIEVAHLSRLVKSAEAQKVKAGLASGAIPIVIGTHALAAKGIRFKDLGLLIVDEEHRFGTAHKAKLRELGRAAHVLTLTATPIPRTLQSALVGLQDLSIIATPPARRQPIRTFLMPFDPVVLRDALMRERERGGQSFVVCPRVADIAPMAEQLRDLVPELDCRVAHGRMPAEETDSVMVDFADGGGDVLLTTNIIESGLDVPRANTIVIWRPDRFGLAQLHQLRGRVGRAHRRGSAYLFTEPAAKIARSSKQRLRTLEALDRLGAGFDISARDLDQRGGGDLFGKEQAGHIKLIGIDLYHHLLGRALRAAQGEQLDEDWSPDLNLDLTGRIPEDYVPEPELRVSIYSRLSRVGNARALEALAEEIEDRFGALPEDAMQLLVRTRLRILCRRLGVARVDAGPKGIALTFRQEGAAQRPVKRLLSLSGENGEWRGERLVISRQSACPAARLTSALDLLESAVEEQA